MRGCLSVNEEQVKKYVEFHQGSFINLCENNYDNLVADAKTECDRYFNLIDQNAILEEKRETAVRSYKEYL